MRRFALAFAASVLTGIYWWVVFTIVYASLLFAGDGNPAAQPRPDREVLRENGITIVVALLLYAVLAMVWQRLFARRAVSEHGKT